MARVIFGFDVVKLERSLAVDLHNCFSHRHHVVVHIGVEIGETPRCERFRFVGETSLTTAEPILFAERAADPSLCWIAPIPSPTVFFADS